MTEKLADFIKDTGITMTATPVPENPNMEPCDPKAERVHFHIVMEHDGRSCMTYFTVGIGMVERWALDSPTRHNRPSKNRAAAKGRMTFPNGNLCRGSISWEEGMEIAKEIYRPELEDVLSCIAGDAIDIERSPRFEDWADEIGFDSDSRKAERTFNVCVKMTNDLRDFFGQQYKRLLAVDLEEL